MGPVTAGSKLQPQEAATAKGTGAYSKAGRSTKRKRQQLEAEAAVSAEPVATDTMVRANLQLGGSGSVGKHKDRHRKKKQRPGRTASSLQAVDQTAWTLPKLSGSKHHKGSAKQHKRKWQCCAEPAARSRAAPSSEKPNPRQEPGLPGTSSTEALAEPPASFQPGQHMPSTLPAEALVAAPVSSSEETDPLQAAIPMARPASTRHARLPVLAEHMCNLNKPWTAEEEGLLVRLVMDDDYRKRTLGVDEVDFEAIARHLGRLTRTYARICQNKYWALERGAAGKKAHSRPRAHISHTLLAISALQRLPDCAGTTAEIYAVIEAEPTLSTSLNWSTCPGTLARPRWRNAISTAMYANRHFFCHTNTKRGRHVVWKLVNMDAAQDFISRQAKHGVPYLGKNHC